MSSSPASAPLLSDDFPYLVTRISPAMYHVIPVPADLSEQEQLVIAQRQIAANKLETCLALGADRAYFLEPRSNLPPALANSPARGGHLVCDKLRPVPEVFYSPAIPQRIELLVAEWKRRVAGLHAAFAMGDLSKGNRPATPADLRRLKGFRNGIPVGLELCDSCQEYRGECLDPGENFRNTVATVHCLCENDNLCAFCEAPLAESRLNANTFNNQDGQIWHLPGFSAFQHQCAETH